MDNPRSSNSGNNQGGFTIIELLITIVVIAILAAVTLVAFNGIVNKSKRAQVDSYLNQASKALHFFKVNGPSDTYPETLDEVNVTAASEITKSYISSTDRKAFCVSGKIGTLYNAYVTSDSGQLKEGSCLNFGLVGHWTFNGTAQDVSGNGNNGSIVGGVTSVADKNGIANSAYHFTTGSYIDMGSKPVFSAPIFTVSVWMKRDDLSQASVFKTQRVTTGVNGSKPYLAAGAWQTSPPGIVNTSWAHVAYVFDDTAQKITFYIDGTLMTVSDAPTKISPFPASSQAYIGGGDLWGPENMSFMGTLDDIRFYTRELKDTEVKSLFDQGPQ